MTKLRRDIMETSEVRKAVTKETAIENKIVNGEDSETLYRKKTIEPRANIKFDFPRLPDWGHRGGAAARRPRRHGRPREGGGGDGLRRGGALGQLAHALGDGGLRRVLARGLRRDGLDHGPDPEPQRAHQGPPLLGLGRRQDGRAHGRPGRQAALREVHPRALGHPPDRAELFGGYDPNKKQLLHEVVIDQDLDPFETARETAEEFKREHGDKVDIFEIPESGAVHGAAQEGRGAVDPARAALRPPGGRPDPHGLGTPRATACPTTSSRRSTRWRCSRWCRRSRRCCRPA